MEQNLVCCKNFYLNYAFVQRMLPFVFCVHGCVFCWKTSMTDRWCCTLSTVMLYTLCAAFSWPVMLWAWQCVCRSNCSSVLFALFQLDVWPLKGYNLMKRIHLQENSGVGMLLIGRIWGYCSLLYMYKE